MTITFAERVELEHCLRRVEEIAAAWHRRDGDSKAAPRIAWLASESLGELAIEYPRPIVFGRRDSGAAAGTVPRPA